MTIVPSWGMGTMWFIILYTIILSTFVHGQRFPQTNLKDINKPKY